MYIICLYINFVVCSGILIACLSSPFLSGTHTAPVKEVFLIVRSLYTGRGGSRGWLGWLVTPLAWQPISCYYYACDLSYFDVVLCPSSTQILATSAQISFSRKPRLPRCSLASLVWLPTSPPLKNPRSANDYERLNGISCDWILRLVPYLISRVVVTKWLNIWKRETGLSKEG